MVLFQLVFSRIIQVYIGFGSIAAFFTFLGYKTLRQEKKRLIITFSLFYFVAALGIFLNLIYAPLSDPDIVEILHYITIYFVILAPIFLTVFCLIYLKGEDIFTTSKQLAVIIIYGVLDFLIIFIPEGVEINADTGWYPHWSWFLFIYVISLLSVMSIIPSVYYSLKIYKKLEDERLKKKWKFFIIGIIELYGVLVGTFFTNTLNDPTFRIIWAPISLLLSITGSYFMYYGVAKKFKV
jgi:hypothetical protein